MNYAGIDNGVSGSLSIITEDGKTIFVPTPVKQVKGFRRLDWNKFIEIFRPYAGNCCVLLEKALQNPKRFKATVSAAKCEEAECIALEQLGIKYIIIDSKMWQKPLFTGKYAKLTTKQASLEFGNDHFPQFKQSKLKDRDALCMAYYLKENPSIFGKK